MKQKNTIAVRKANRKTMKESAREPLTVIREDSQFDMEAHEEQMDWEARIAEEDAKNEVSSEGEISESDKPAYAINNTKIRGLHAMPIIEDSREEQDASALQTPKAKKKKGKTDLELKNEAYEAKVALKR